jgi:hypothetical protein
MGDHQLHIQVFAVIIQDLKSRYPPLLFTKINKINNNNNNNSFGMFVAIDQLWK